MTSRAYSRTGYTSFEASTPFRNQEAEVLAFLALAPVGVLATGADVAPGALSVLADEAAPAVASTGQPPLPAPTGSAVAAGGAAIAAGGAAVAADEAAVFVGAASAVAGPAESDDAGAAVFAGGASVALGASVEAVAVVGFFPSNLLTQKLLPPPLVA